VYKASRHLRTKSALRRVLNEDLVPEFRGINGERVILQSYIFSVVSWNLDRRRSRWFSAPRSRLSRAMINAKIRRPLRKWFGITRKHATVEK
jgi:hypothetical protein